MLSVDGFSFSVSGMSLSLWDVVVMTILLSSSGFVVESEDLVLVYAGGASSSGTCVVSGSFAFPMGTS